VPSRFFLSAKIHGATVTGAKVDYEGSLSIDPRLMAAVGILPFERVDVYNLDNGERLTTYAIVGGPGEVCLNGAAALRGEPGQRVIVAAYALVDERELAAFRPKIAIVDKDNAVVSLRERTVFPDPDAA
jgi:aspartate 1-decarboxylase